MDLRSSVFTVCLCLVLVLIIGCNGEKKLNDTCYKPCRVKSGPVCGNDGRNYSTQCHLSVSRCQARKIGQIIYVKSKGFCRSSKPLSTCALNCTARRQPLCGSDNLTYKNLCLFKKAKCEKRKKKLPAITVLSRRGPCPRMKPTAKSKLCRRLSTCPKVRRPVCGSDNKTYKNICHLKTRNCNIKGKAILRGRKTRKLTLQYCGVCGRSKKCSSLWQQKCPSFKLCDQLLAKAKSGAQRVGRSRPVSKTGKKKTMKKTKSKGKKGKKVIPKVKRQFMVCGSDGRNYASICHLQIEQCNKRNKCQRLQMRYKGPCRRPK